MNGEKGQIWNCKSCGFSNGVVWRKIMTHTQVT